MLFFVAFNVYFISVINALQVEIQRISKRLYCHNVSAYPSQDAHVTYFFVAKLIYMSCYFPQAHAIHVKVKTGSYHFTLLLAFTEAVIYDKQLFTAIAFVSSLLGCAVITKAPFDYFL